MLILGVELDSTSNSNTYLVLLKFPMNPLELKEVLIVSWHRVDTVSAECEVNHIKIELACQCYVTTLPIQSI